MWSYDKKQTEILDVETWYNKFAHEYKKHHKFLAEFDRNLWQRFMPRNLEWKTIVDLGCGDGRISSFFAWKNIKEYVWVDISENMLKNTKSYVKKIKHNLNEKFPIQNEYADVIISLFTLLHIDNIQNFLEETYRILKGDGVFIIFHHTERRNYKYSEWKNTYKIHTYTWNYREVEKLLDYNFFKFDIYEIKEDWILNWKYYVCRK